MDLSSRIYSRKVLYRLIYMYNFFNAILNKNIYLNFADKIDNIVKQGLDKIEVKDYEKYDFSIFLRASIKNKSYVFDIKDYINSFNPKNESEFNDLVSYTASNFVITKHNTSIDYQYIVNNMSYLMDNYYNMIDDIDDNLDTFKFFELNSVDQSILLLGIIENICIGTPKAIIIKECLFLASTFTSSNSIKLINAVLDKVIK